MPTASDPYTDGAAVLAQSRDNFVAGIDYYLGALDYINSENIPEGTDPQEDESAIIVGQLISIRNSLVDDTQVTLTEETIKEYIISNADTEWELKLVFDFLEQGLGGSLIHLDGNSVPEGDWEITGFDIEEDRLYIEMDYAEPGYWGGGNLTAEVSSDILIL